MDYYDYVSDSESPPERAEHSVVLSQQELFERILKDAQRVSTFTGLNLDLALRVLKHYQFEPTRAEKFNQERERVLEDISYHTITVGTYQDAQRKKACNSEQTNCQICQGTNKVKEMISSSCGHAFCEECYRSWIFQTIDSPCCPEQKCRAPVSYTTIVKLSENNGKALKLFKKKLCEQFCSSNGSLVSCKGPNCGNIIQVDRTSERLFKCNCGTTICTSCGERDHFPASCVHVKEYQESSIFSEANDKWIQANTRNCPNVDCKKSVNRFQGCNMMVCLCKCEFCYVCGEAWKPLHDNHFKCPNQDKVDIEKKTMMPESNLRHMTFCLDRINQNNYLINNIRAQNHSSSIEQLVKKQKIQQSQFIAFEEAITLNSQFSHYLKWTYVFISKRSPPRKDALKAPWEKELANFEAFKKKLTLLLTTQLRQLFVQSSRDDSDASKIQFKFKGMKEQVIALSESTRRAFESFKDELSRANLSKQQKGQL